MAYLQFTIEFTNNFTNIIVLVSLVIDSPSRIVFKEL